MIVILSVIALAGIFSCGQSTISDVAADEPAIPAPPVSGDLPSSRKIVPKTDCVYHGAFLGEDTITAAKIEAFELMSGKDLDIVLKFLAFNAMGTTGGFPLAEAETVSDKGAVLFIKLEPWSWDGADDDSFSLEKIISGDFDGRLASFASDAGEYGDPLFVSFGHEMNADWYPWGGKPELYKEAYIHIHDLMGKYATNITWVWNPDIGGDTVSDYYPGNEYVDWVAADGYNTEDYGNSWKSAQLLFDSVIDDLEGYGKPVMIGETACDANDEDDETVNKPQWLFSMVAWITGKRDSGDSDNLIKAYVYFNFDKTEEGQLKGWAISRAEARSKYKQTLTDHSAFFKGINP